MIHRQPKNFGNKTLFVIVTVCVSNYGYSSFSEIIMVILNCICANREL